MYERVATLLVGALYLYNIAVSFRDCLRHNRRETYRFAGNWQRRCLSRFDFSGFSSPLAPPTSPMDFSNCRASRGEEPAPMIQSLRKIHRRIFIILALLLPALFLSGIVFRYSWPTANQSRNLTTCPLPSGATP